MYTLYYVICFNKKSIRRISERDCTRGKKWYGTTCTIRVYYNVTVAMPMIRSRNRTSRSQSGILYIALAEEECFRARLEILDAHSLGPITILHVQRRAIYLSVYLELVSSSVVIWRKLDIYIIFSRNNYIWFLKIFFFFYCIFKAFIQYRYLIYKIYEKSNWIRCNLTSIEKKKNQLLICCSRLWITIIKQIRWDNMYIV